MSDEGCIIQADGSMIVRLQTEYAVEDLAERFGVEVEDVICSQGHYTYRAYKQDVSDALQTLPGFEGFPEFRSSDFFQSRTVAKEGGE